MNQEKILEIKDLKRNYSMVSPNGETITYCVLKGISFSVKRGEFISIMGSSGCGKTTLLKTLGMLNKADSGVVKYKGEDTAEIYGEHLAEIRRKEVAFVFQDFYLLDSLTVMENIMIPLILNEDDPNKGKNIAKEVAKKLGIDKLLNKKPYELSGGEKQRTAICRALAENPELILADEPTGNLDVETGFAITQLLHSISEAGSLVIMTTHNMQLLWEYPGRVYRCADHLITDVTEQYSVASSTEEK